jgi:hypothetical protein
LQPKRSIIDRAFSRIFGIVPPTGITIYAALNNLRQALNDTPISTPTASQLQHECLPLTAHQFLHYVGSWILRPVRATVPLGGEPRFWCR